MFARLMGEANRRRHQGCTLNARTVDCCRNKVIQGYPIASDEQVLMVIQNKVDQSLIKCKLGSFINWKHKLIKYLLLWFITTTVNDTITSG